MNCKGCHHISDAHISSEESKSIGKFGKCLIKTCSCEQFIDPIMRIDEDLV